MPRKSRLVPNGEPGQKIDVKPISLGLTVLAFIGKPFYFMLSNWVVGIAFLLSLIGHLVNSLAAGFVKAVSTPVKKVARPAKPRVKIPNVGSFFKLETLRISLLELKILSRIRKLFVKRVTRFQKLKLKKRIAFVVLVVGVLSVLTYVYLAIFKSLPSPKQLSQREPEVSTKIYDRNGVLLYKIFKDENRTIVPLSDIPPHVRLATLAAEDAEFYNHPGFSIRGIIRALATDAQTGSLQGGSTITQQLVKNVLLTPEKTLIRKIKELILSIGVEATYTKDQILEMYLNEVSYGGTAYGIEEASRSYFGKTVKELNLAEAAFLAGLPKSPTLYSPFGQNPDLAIQRQREVIHLMAVNKFITPEQERDASSVTLKFVANRTQIKAPHFVMYIRQLLVDKYGEEMVEKGGLEVTTSLDLSIEEAAESIVQSEVGKLSGLHVGNGAALVLNPKTGEVLAMVGSKDYFNIEADGNVNVLTRLRQPGSSIKVVNYAYALSNREYTPATIINDSPITYVTPGSPPYSPVNYDGQFRGNVSLRSALAQSRNIPAVKILASYGVDKMIEEGRRLGVTTWNDPSQYGLSLTLGGGGVKGMDLAKVYSTIANNGNRSEFMPILQVKDYKGRILEKNVPQGEIGALDPRVAYSLIDILKDNAARAPEFGFNSALVVKNHPEVAVKTGTSNDLRDNWTVGFNQNYLVLAWVGNNDNSPMSRIASGITGAAPIWNKIMTTILADSPSIDWNVPEGMSKVNICTITGTLPCNGCPTRQEWFLDENKPSKSCSAELIQQMTSPTPIPGGKILDSAASTGN